MLEWLRFGATALLLTAGLLTLLVGVIGQYRYHFCLNRMHPASMGDTLGLLACMLGLCISAPDLWTAAKLLLIVAFLWMAAPVSGHLIARLELTCDDGLPRQLREEKR